MLQSLFYLTTALHVSGVTITHLQEHKTTVTTASGNRYTVLLSAAIMEELVGPTHDQQHCYNHAPAVKPEAATAVVKLLMMGMRTSKTC